MKKHNARNYDPHRQHIFHRIDSRALSGSILTSVVSKSNLIFFVKQKTKQKKGNRKNAPTMVSLFLHI
jgi:hypothetical protein